MLAELVAERRRPGGHRRGQGLRGHGGTTRWRPLVDEAIAAHPDAWERYRAGDDKVAGFFVGQVMKATKGQADGKAVTALLEQKAAADPA